MRPPESRPVAIAERPKSPSDCSAALPASPPSHYSRTVARRANTPGCLRSVPITPAAMRHIATFVGSVETHGTNPASAQMCGMEVVVVRCDDNGNVDVADHAPREKYSKPRCADDHLSRPRMACLKQRSGDLLHRSPSRRTGHMDGANLNAHRWASPSSRARC